MMIFTTYIYGNKKKEAETEKVFTTPLWEV